MVLFRYCVKARISSIVSTLIQPLPYASLQSYKPENLSSLITDNVQNLPLCSFLHIVMKWGGYIILWNLGSWHQMPFLIPTVLQTSGADHSLHLVILLQFIKGIWCKEEAVWWKVILKVKAKKICDFFYWPKLTLKYPVNWDASYHKLTLRNNKKILSYVGIWCKKKYLPPKNLH